jgi:2-oxoglutarate dehydrogenase E2 component (dihydrolipoamide succinyltransferase)
MKIEIKIPSFGESVVEATVGAILIRAGSSVQVDEDLLELETDKLNQVLHASHAGVVSWSVKPGDVVRVGQVIGEIDTSAQGSLPPPPPKTEATPKPKVENKELPQVRKKVDDAILEMGKLPKKEEAATAPKTVITTDNRQTRTKMTKLRRVIAERLVEVKNKTAMLTTFNEVDMSTVMAVREKEQENFQKKHGVKLGFMSFFIKAAVAALEEFPEINGQIEGDEIVLNHFYDVSVAVSTDKGLMVPVIRNANTLSYAEIEKQLKTLAEKARVGSISIDDLQGGTFTITNAGLFGSLLSTPILNPPQSGILGMHNIVKRAVVVNDAIVIRPMMYLALSYDHRIVDGKQAVSFLMHIKKNLEEPARLLLDL